LRSVREIRNYRTTLTDGPLLGLSPSTRPPKGALGRVLTALLPATAEEEGLSDDRTTINIINIVNKDIKKTDL
jgi:hypothetical protein